MDNVMAQQLIEQLKGIRQELQTANLFRYRDMLREKVDELDPDEVNPELDALLTDQLAGVEAQVLDRLG